MNVVSITSTNKHGAPVSEWVKRWPTDLVSPGSIPALGGNLSNHKRGSIGNSFSLLSNHRPDMTEIRLKRKKDVKSQITYPSIQYTRASNRSSKNVPKFLYN